MRKSVWIPLVLIAAAVLYGGLWYVTAATVRTLTLQWLGDRRQEGLLVTHDTAALTGFPFKPGVKIPNLAIAAPALADSPAWAWRMDDLGVFARPLLFDRFFLDLAGTHTLMGLWTSGQADVKQADATIKPAGGHADITVGGVTAGTFMLEKASVKTVSTGKATHAEIAVENATLPDMLPPPLSRTLQSLKLSVDITGPVTTGARLPDVLEHWRAGGGTIEVRAGEINWPPVSAAGAGTVTLDHNLQPEGAFTATFRGFMDVVDMLVAAGRMDNQQASLARGGLLLLSKTPDDGSAPYLDLSLTVQDRKVTAGPVTLMDMPRIIWRRNIIVP